MNIWLDNVGGVKVERMVGYKQSGSSVTLTKPRKGILHTTEGGWSGSLSVFKTKGTPHFMVGRDSAGKIRVGQFMPIGAMALTLVNESGGVETNRDAVVQIECVGFSSRDFGWYLGLDKRRVDGEVRAVVAELVRKASAAAGIPLKRGGNGSRSVTRWKEQAGWFGHSEVPENVHWDPGAMDWDDLFERAGVKEFEVRFELWVQEPEPKLIAASGYVAVPGNAKFRNFFENKTEKVLELVQARRRPFFRKRKREV